MPIELPPLPWEKDALQPHISKETIEYHYGKASGMLVVYGRARSRAQSVDRSTDRMPRRSRRVDSNHMLSSDTMSPIPRPAQQHHAGYVTKLIGMVKGTEWENSSVDDIMLKAPAGGLFNNAAQIWNHSFFWQSLVRVSMGLCRVLCRLSPLAHLRTHADPTIHTHAHTTTRPPTPAAPPPAPSPPPSTSRLAVSTPSRCVISPACVVMV